MPHLYAFKHYKWSRRFFESRNLDGNFICAANQISKSSTQIRKCIEWATNKTQWKGLWPTRTPNQFWYLYPSSFVATVEFDKKWVPEFLPRNSYKDHPIYGWKEKYRAGYIQSIEFNTGITIFFKTYSQDSQDLQSGTVDAIFFDEELPVELISELQARLFASNGYLNGVMTPTLGQEYWREVFEVRGDRERFKGALKLNVSMYDCLEYEDGSKSFWTEERIQRIKNACKSEAEIQRRVYGKFVSDSGLKYPSFNRDINIIKPVPIPKDYSVYIGVDCGSGGENHPSAITFVAVAPDFSKGYIFKGRRIDNQITTASDLVAIVQQMKAEVTNPISAIFYDHAATDLREIAARMGEAWIPAEKSHAIGEQALNVLFKNNMLQIFQTDELEPLAMELCSLKLATPKNQAHDDFCDSARYAVSKIPWDWGVINAQLPELTRQKTEIDLRRDMFKEPEYLEWSVEDEIEATNELLEQWGYS